MYALPPHIVPYADGIFRQLAGEHLLQGLTQ
jgi:hypothetical protein